MTGESNQRSKRSALICRIGILIIRGRHPHRPFRGLFRLYSCYGPPDCSAAQGDLWPFRLPDRAARQLPVQSTTLSGREPSSTSDSRLRGAQPSKDIPRTAIFALETDHKSLGPSCFPIWPTLTITQLKLPGKHPYDKRLQLCHIALHHLRRRLCGSARGFVGSGWRDCVHSVAFKFIDETSRGQNCMANQTSTIGDKTSTSITKPQSVRATDDLLSAAARRAEDRNAKALEFMGTNPPP